MGLNDERELDFEKGMRWEGVSSVCSVSALKAHCPRRIKFFLTSLSVASGVFCDTLISDFSNF
jgi:hypothetical protein